MHQRQGRCSIEKLETIIIIIMKILHIRSDTHHQHSEADNLDNSQCIRHHHFAIDILEYLVLCVEMKMKIQFFGH